LLEPWNGGMIVLFSRKTGGTALSEFQMI